MKNEFSFLAKIDDVNKRLDIYLRDNIKEFSRSFIIKAVEDGNVFVNGKRESKNYRIKDEDVVLFINNKKEKISLEAEDLKLKIWYEDEHLMVVEKPKGMAIYPTKEHLDKTFANGLLALGRPLSDFAGRLRPGIVHRLDKDTSGLVLIAKNNLIHERLVDLMIKKEIMRIYHGISRGIFTEDFGSITAPIGRHPKNRVIMSTHTDSIREARTDYKVLKRFENYTYLELKLDTGRKHQIRVHLNSINRPLAGEKTYNNIKNLPPAEKQLRGQCLHGKILGFHHPITYKWIEIEGALPKYFTDFIDNIN